MRTIRTFNAYHLGDNLVHLNFLRKAAIQNPDIQFVHTAHDEYLKQMKEFVSDIPNIKLGEYGYLEPKKSINAWRGADSCWHDSPIREDFVKFHIKTWFPVLAEKMEIDNPITAREQMLFDAPCIQKPVKEFSDDPFDVLLINSPPQSGQFHGYDQNALTTLAWILLNAGKKVISTDKVPGIWDGAVSRLLETRCTTDRKPRLSAAEIGHLSLHCKTIVMVATGPCWPTFNIWNQEVNRVIFLDYERIFLTPNTIHCKNVPTAAVTMEKLGLI